MELPEELLARTWDQYDWKHAENTLAELQKALTIAAFAHDDKRIFDIQKRIVRNDEVKALAVKHVTDHASGPGVDKVKWTTSADKMRAVSSLDSKNYHASPMKQVIIHSKPTGKERRIGIPTFYDRAMQVLYDYSFAPVAEAWADRKSFAFRPGRSLHDANSYILEALKGHDAPEWVVVTDVQSYYSTIQHSWLLSHAPMDKGVLREFLKCGHVFAGELFPAEEAGISLGANLSPRLGNFTLDGLQKYVFERLNEGWDGKSEIDYHNGDMVRAADDIFFAVRSKEDGEAVLSILNDFLAERGLTISRNKTKICSVYEGFSFLSRTYIKKGNLIHVYPAKDAEDRLIAALRELILTHKKSQRSLIDTLNSRLKRWADYHRFTDAYDAFCRIDTAVNSFLLEAAIAKHTKMPQAKVIHRYWYKRGDGKWVYALPDQKDVYVMPLADVMLVSHQKVVLNKNPYVDIDYFESREHARSIRNITGRYIPVWMRQEGKCYYCGRPILDDQPRAVIQLDLSRPTSSRNLAYVHKICQPNELTVHYVSEDVEDYNTFDLIKLLETIKEAGERPPSMRIKGEIKKNWRHIKLKNYFAEQTAASITLTFSDIEKIDGKPLPVSARQHSSYWYPRDNCNVIAEAWITEGYEMKKLDMEKEKITFKRASEGLAHVDLPKWLTDGKIPKNARFEIETYLEHIEKKYGL